MNGHKDDGVTTPGFGDVPMPAFLGRRMQLGFVVRDLDQALLFWTTTMKAGPFVVIEEAMADRIFVHRGEPSPVKATLAFAYVGETQLEFIMPRNDAPSPYREFLSLGREGLQHIAFWPEDYDGACDLMERNGFAIVCEIGAAGATRQVKYYEGPAHLGVMVELAPTTPDRVRYFDGIKALSDGWDGSRPIRRFRSRADYMASDDCVA